MYVQHGIVASLERQIGSPDEVLAQTNMSKSLYGWGSNLHGQLRRPLAMTQCEEPMYIDKVDSIIGATGSQIFVSLDQQSFYYGLTADEQDWSSDQERHSLPWNSV